MGDGTNEAIYAEHVDSIITPSERPATAPKANPTTPKEAPKNAPPAIVARIDPKGPTSRFFVEGILSLRVDRLKLAFVFREA